MYWNRSSPFAENQFASEDDVELEKYLLIDMRRLIFFLISVIHQYAYVDLNKLSECFS
jgi:hypothetical protein